MKQALRDLTPVSEGSSAVLPPWRALVGDHVPSADELARRDRETAELLATALRERHGLPAPTPALEALSVRSRLAKRLLDVVGAVGIILLLLPVLVVTAVVVRLTSDGAALFAQERVGRHGRTFRMYKFRSMHVGTDDAAHREYVARLIQGEAESEGGVFKLVADPRITRVGRFIRRYSIDELPQLWNVLRGDMSLVGPRPALPHEVELYDEVALQRLAVQPGLTGLWQVSGRCQLSFADMVDLDVRYWQEWSLRSDLKILLMTPVVAVTARGAA